jgi:hypothetical protein
MNRITDKELLLLESCKSEKDWSIAAKRIKDERGGEYPDDWWEKVKMSGLMARVTEQWGGSAELSITSFATKAAMIKYLKPSAEDHRYDLDELDTDGLT